MEKSLIMKQRIFKGAGVILGFVIGSVSGIIVAAITGIMGLISAIGAAIAIPTGLFLENKFQGIQSEQNKKGLPVYILLIFLGSVLFFICFFLAK
jgi:hypothetical protein